MALKLPESMDECVYFTNRSLLDDEGKPAGKIVCWAPRMKCPKCKKDFMHKPYDEKTGKYKVRATEYVCPSCKYTEEKKEHEGKLSANGVYTCPSCHKSGEGTVPFARKTYMGVKAIVFDCASCKGKIAVTKKLKEIKKKKGKEAVADLPDDDDDF
jgi:ssDNA-binding Zn-finger/Zn-ribbon topoisomerase 1